MSTSDSYPNLLLALCIWREARGESRAVKIAIKHVILNRAAHPKPPYAGCTDIVGNILAPYQFSSFDRTDPNASLLPNPHAASDWKAWLDCCSVVDEQTSDPTNGSNSYHSYPVSQHEKWPAWADDLHMMARIGSIRFYKL